LSAQPVVRVRVPAVLRELAGGRAEVPGEGTTVGQVLEGLRRAHPALVERIVDGQGQQRRYVSVFLNDEDLRGLGGLEAPVRDGDVLAVVPALAGGSR
jgi:sulfur-carrier protein